MNIPDLPEKPRKRRLSRVLSPAVLSAFLTLLSTTGSVQVAARRLGLNRKNLYFKRDHDAEFRAKWEEAVKDSQQSLEDEAYRRAVIGVEEPVFQGGRLVGTVQKYSDGLLTFLLKAHNPNKYSEKLQVSGPNGKAIPVSMDLTKLADDELTLLEQLLTKAAANVSSDKGGESQA
jgi:hypothetical protein